jgi:hypothetical protein
MNTVFEPLNLEQELVEAMNKLAIKHPRWGYRSITKLLKDEGWKVNEVVPTGVEV